MDDNRRYTRRRPTTLSDLSNDLLIEILANLPLKSIIRCTSLCKSFLPLLSSLTDPRFISLHFHRHHLKPPNLLLTTSFSSPTSFQILDFPHHKTTIVNPNFSPRSKLKVIGSSCNGFFCLSNCTDFICLFNPTTHQHIQLPIHPASNFILGFGFDPTGNDYKVIRFANKFSLDSSFMVYSLRSNSNSWSTIKGNLNDTLSLESHVLNVYNAAHVKGILHWACAEGVSIEEPNPSNLRPILYFSLVTEKFGTVLCPRGLKGFTQDLRLGVWDGCLAMFDTIPYVQVDIWSMMEYGVEESWVRVISIQFDRIRDTTIHRVLHPIQLCKDGKILLQMGESKLILYDPMDKTSIIPVIDDAPDFFRATTYVENLTSIASLMVQNKVEG